MSGAEDYKSPLNIAEIAPLEQSEVMEAKLLGRPRCGCISPIGYNEVTLWDL